jgi:hypothetical protein
MTGPSNWRTAYPLFLFGMVIIGISNYWLIRRMEKKNSIKAEKNQATEK